MKENSKFTFSSYWKKFGTVSIMLLLLVVLMITKPDRKSVV